MGIIIAAIIIFALFATFACWCCCCVSGAADERMQNLLITENVFNGKQCRKEEITQEATGKEMVAGQYDASEYEPYTAPETEAAYRLGNGDYLYIQACDGGYDYTFYRGDFSEIDGGQLDNPDLSILSARDEILAMHELIGTAAEALDMEAFEQAQEAVCQRDSGDSLSQIMEVIAEKFGCKCELESDGKTVLLETYSPEGQDICMECVPEHGSGEEFIKLITEYAADYDPDEEASYWIGPDGHGKNGAPYRLRDLLADMEWAENFFTEVARFANDFYYSAKSL